MLAPRITFYCFISPHWNRKNNDLVSIEESSHLESDVACCLERQPVRGCLPSALYSLRARWRQLVPMIIYHQLVLFVKLW